MNKSINERIKDKVSQDGAKAVEKWSQSHKTKTRLAEIQAKLKKGQSLVYTVYLPYQDDEGNHLGFLPEATYGDLERLRRDFITPHMKVHMLFLGYYEELKSAMHSSNDALILISYLD